MTDKIPEFKWEDRGDLLFYLYINGWGYDVNIRQTVSQYKIIAVIYRDTAPLEISILGELHPPMFDATQIDEAKQWVAVYFNLIKEK